MKVILASSIGGSIKENGVRVPAPLSDYNGMLDKIQTMWPDNANVMMVCASPNNYDINDSLYTCFKETFPMSGLCMSSFNICDGRNEEIIENLNGINVIVLVGGHAPTQNAFMEKINLKEKLQCFDGIVIAWSAGSMNCAETVYAGPELEGEAIDPNYQRWIPGLGLTKINIFPHFQSLQDEMLDGLRLIEDITYADSMGHEFVALNDGSYILIENDTEVVYGEAYSIKDGCRKQICKNGESIVLG